MLIKAVTLNPEKHLIHTKEGREEAAQGQRNRGDTFKPAIQGTALNLTALNLLVKGQRLSGGIKKAISNYVLLGKMHFKVEDAARLM